MLCIVLFFRVRFYETATTTLRKKVGESEERSKTFKLISLEVTFVLLLKQTLDYN